MSGGSGGQVEGIPTREALAQALAALTEGRHDARIADGAQANALESIAWSLIGLLQAQTKEATADGAEETIGSHLRRAGFLTIDPQPDLAP